MLPSISERVRVDDSNPFPPLSFALSLFLSLSLSPVSVQQDIHIWSASSMKFVELKMREMGVADSPDFKLSAYYDHRAMVTVRTARHGVYDCKPLPLIWAKFPGVYGPHNTIMLDDLKRNYVFNPGQGLVIRPYRKSATRAATDRELEKLAVYLLHIATTRSTFEGLRHSRWEREVGAGRLDRLLAAPPGRGLAALGLETPPGGGGGRRRGSGRVVGMPRKSTTPLSLCSLSLTLCTGCHARPARWPHSRSRAPPGRRSRPPHPAGRGRAGNGRTG